MGDFLLRFKNWITVLRRAANAYGSYSTSGGLQAMGVSKGWVQARDGCLQRKTWEFSHPPWARGKSVKLSKCGLCLLKFEVFAKLWHAIQSLRISPFKVSKFMRNYKTRDMLNPQSFKVCKTCGWSFRFRKLWHTLEITTVWKIPSPHVNGSKSCLIL